MKNVLYGLRISLAVRLCSCAVKCLPDGDSRWILVTALMELLDFLRYMSWCEGYGTLSNYRVFRRQFKIQPWAASEEVR